MYGNETSILATLSTCHRSGRCCVNTALAIILKRVVLVRSTFEFTEKISRGYLTWGVELDSSKIGGELDRAQSIVHSRNSSRYPHSRQGSVYSGASVLYDSTLVGNSMLCFTVLHLQGSAQTKAQVIKKK